MKTAWKRILGTALVALFVVSGTATLASAAPGERLLSPALRAGGLNVARRAQNLEGRIARLIENKTRVEEHLANAQAAVTRLEERIPTIEDPVMKEFAERQLAILERRVEQITGRLGLLAEQLALLQDMLKYSQSL